MVQFHVPDMTCGSCANRIGRALAQAGLPADLQVDIDVAARHVRARGRHGSEWALAVQQAIECAGYTAAVLPDAPVSAKPSTGGCCCALRGAKAVDAGQREPAQGAGCCG